METTTARPSLLLLHEYCLLEVFDFLILEDSMNLAESCIYLRNVANRTFRKCSTIRLNGKMAKKGKGCISRFFNHFGHHVLSLSIYSSWGLLDCTIVKNCVNLKRLRISGINAFKNVPSPFTVDNLEVLALVDCGSKFANDFLSVVHQSKALNFKRCSNGINALTTVFKNNLDVKSFVWSNYSRKFPFELLEVISNVDKLSLSTNFKNISELDPLLNLNLLKKLKLECGYKNINSFLTELAKNGIMQELELWCVEVDENFFEVLKLFDDLQLLVLDSSLYKVLPSSIAWPPKLKHLRLQHFVITFDAFLSTMKQLKYLESIDFANCQIAEVDLDNFYDGTKMSQSILHSSESSFRQQRLDVVLPCRLTSNEQRTLIDSERLKIIIGIRGEGKLQIGIEFPEFDK